MLASLKQSIEQFGIAEPFVVNVNRTIIGGHQRFRAYMDLGITHVPVVWVDLPPAAERALNIALNRIKGQFDPIALRESLLEVQEADIDPQAVGFAADELLRVMAEASRLLDDAKQTTGPAELPPDLAAPGQGECLEFQGQRVVAAAASPASMQALLAGDRDRPSLLLGDIPSASVGGLHDVLAAADGVLREGASIYIATDHRLWPLMMAEFDALGWHFSTVIVACIPKPISDGRAFDQTHVGLFYGWKEGTNRYFRPERNRGDFWKMDGPTGLQDPTTVLTEAIIGEAVRNSTARGDVVLDVSPSTSVTLAACARLGRLGRGVDPDPQSALRALTNIAQPVEAL